MLFFETIGLHHRRFIGRLVIGHALLSEEACLVGRLTAVNNEAPLKSGVCSGDDWMMKQLRWWAILPMGTWRSAIIEDRSHLQGVWSTLNLIAS